MSTLCPPESLMWKLLKIRIPPGFAGIFRKYKESAELSIQAYTNMILQTSHAVVGITFYSHCWEDLEGRFNEWYIGYHMEGSTLLSNLTATCSTTSTPSGSGGGSRTGY